MIRTFPRRAAFALVVAALSACATSKPSSPPAEPGTTGQEPPTPGIRPLTLEQEEAQAAKP